MLLEKEKQWRFEWTLDFGTHAPWNNSFSERIKNYIRKRIHCCWKGKERKSTEEFHSLIPFFNQIVQSKIFLQQKVKKLISCLELWEKRVRVGKIGCLARKNIAPLGKMLLAMMDTINNSARVGKHVSLAGKNVIRPRTIFALAGKNTRENNCAWEK